MLAVLSPHAFIDLADLRAHLKREAGAESDFERRAVEAINSATSWLETRTRRRLKSRIYRAPVSFSATVANNDANVTGSGFTAGVYVGDTAYGGSVGEGAVVLAVSSNTNVVMSRNSLATGATTVYFGSEQLLCDGYADDTAQSPEFPVTQLLAAYSIEDDGTQTALDVSGARISSAGLIQLPNDSFPSGASNIALAVRAGYIQPSETEIGHRAECDALRRLSFRLAEVYYTDDLAMRGRTESNSFGNASASASTLRMPDDIEGAVLTFVRRVG